MFTGIIEETGRLRSLDISGVTGRIELEASKVLEGTNIGDSIAVNVETNGKVTPVRGNRSTAPNIFSMV